MSRRLFATRSAILAPLAICLALTTASCSRQPEGERCSLQNNNADCDGNGDPNDPGSLYCTSSSSLREGADGVDRCCPASGQAVDDVRCSRRVGGGTGGGTGTGGGANGGAGGETSGTGGVSGLGDQCDYTSQCNQPLVCGPSGVCQYECNEDRDCSGDLICSATRSCVAFGAGGQGG